MAKVNNKNTYNYSTYYYNICYIYIISHIKTANYIILK